MAMFRSRTFLPLFALLTAVTLVIADDARAADTKPPRRTRTPPQPAPLVGEPYNLVFLGPEGAVLLRLIVDTGKRTITDTRRDYAGVVFRTLDADSSSVLEPAEAVNIPANGQLSANAPLLGGDWTTLDTAPADDTISPDEFFAFVDQQLGPRFRVTLKTRLQQSVRLGELDTNGDTLFSQHEIAAGLSVLHINDFDDDGTLSVAELQPYPTAMRQAILQQQAAAANEIPLLVLTTEADRARACERVLIHYAAAGDSATESRGVPCVKIGGASADVVMQHDRDGDAHLNAEELTALLAGDAPRLTISVQLSRSLARVADKSRPPLVEFLPPDRDAPQRLQTRLAGMPVSVGASNNREGRMSDADVIVNQALIRFIEADADKNQYLDATEFMVLRSRLPELGLPDVEYAGVDADKNGMVTRDELRSFAETNVGLAEATLVLTVSDDARTLFEILDMNFDNRLSPREFLEGFTRMDEYDHNQDGRFGMSEMRSEYGFVVSRARPQFLLATRANQAMLAAPGVPRVSAGTSGPTWFRKMDRNQDGDVAWREFLGPRADFERIDADRNGLIDLNEAAAAE